MYKAFSEIVLKEYIYQTANKYISKMMQQRLSSKLITTAAQRIKLNSWINVDIIKGTWTCLNYMFRNFIY